MVHVVSLNYEVLIVCGVRLLCPPKVVV
uniref:Uncharacterized protein n=1 Tax=Arundo donax TaxID=35708 RepID=A0A0A8ZBA4_ARUDO